MASEYPIWQRLTMGLRRLRSGLIVQRVRPWRWNLNLLCSVAPVLADFPGVSLGLCETLKVDS